MINAVIGVLIALLIAVIPLVAAARRLNISYPIVLVVGGLVLGFIPGLPHIHLNPDLVLLLFLPPLLYWESITAPTDAMAENVRQIALLAVVLVIMTTIVVAVIAHAIIPGMDWGVAFVLGAIVSPTDELAAVPVLAQFRLPRQLIAIIDGESLLNDATSLVIYGVAVAVVMTGTFHPMQTAGQFVLIVVASPAIGLVVGRFGVELWRRVQDAQLQLVISLILPFSAYFPAQRFGLSGVLAVVTAGVYINHLSPRVITPAARTQAIGFWDTLVFVTNAVLFLLVGLQLHDVASAAFARNSWQTVIGYSVIVNVAVITVRLTLAVLAEFAPVPAPDDHAAPNFKNALVVAWSGLRGSVSLAAGLAIPLVLPNGSPFPDRDLIIFVTFSVIVMTLVGGGLSLPLLVRKLGIERGTEEGDELRLALIAVAQAALTRIGELEAQGTVDHTHAQKLRNHYLHRIDLQREAGERDGRRHLSQHRDVEGALLEAQRSALIALRENGEIDNVVMRHVQAALDAAVGRSTL